MAKRKLVVCPECGEGMKRGSSKKAVGGGYLTAYACPARHGRWWCLNGVVTTPVLSVGRPASGPIGAFCPECNAKMGYHSDKGSITNVRHRETLGILYAYQCPNGHGSWWCTSLQEDKTRKAMFKLQQLYGDPEPCPACGDILVRVSVTSRKGISFGIYACENLHEFLGNKVDGKLEFTPYVKASGKRKPPLLCPVCKEASNEYASNASVGVRVSYTRCAQGHKCKWLPGKIFWQMVGEAPTGFNSWGKREEIMNEIKAIMIKVGDSK